MMMTTGTKTISSKVISNMLTIGTSSNITTMKTKIMIRNMTMSMSINISNTKTIRKDPIGNKSNILRNLDSHISQQVSSIQSNLSIK